MKFKKITAMIMALGFVLSMVPSIQSKAQQDTPNTSDVFYDDFSGDTLDSSKWLVANKRWGGDNGGVVKENVSVSDGTLKLEGHGLKYSGDVPGIKRADGKLTGAAIATREYYSSGSYEVVAKVAPDLGACSALWTFEYEEYYPGDEEYDPKYATGGYCTVNHEIDIEIPTGTSKNPDPNFSSARFNTYTRENAHTSHFHDLGFSVNDGKFHTYRFDWHTGDTNETARVDFYIDGKLLYTSKTNIPTKAGRFWIGVWFPYAMDSDKDGKYDTGWSGLADFDTTVFEIDSVKITPYHESCDEEQNESYGYDGWAENSFPELVEKENYEHVANGDFSKGEESWTLEGDAKIADENAVLTSGQKTDKVWQLVKVIPKGTYTLTADIITDGVEVTLGASKENGNKNQCVTTTESGKLSVTFTNEESNETLKIYVKVERWQGNDNEIKVDNITMKGVPYVEGVKKTFIPLGQEAPPESEDTNDNTSKIDNEDQIADVSANMKKPKRVVIKSLKKKSKKSALIKWKKISGATGYEIKYSRNKKFKSSKKKYVKKTGKRQTMIKRLKKGTWYVKVRAYKLVKKNGKIVKVYGKYSKVKKIRIK